jgi:hypothetical protein
VGPQRLHCEHAFAQYLEAALVSRAVILHLIDVPAPANAEDETTRGESIETGDRFCRDNGSRCGTSAIPVPRRRVRVAAAANASATKGSYVCE